MKFKNFEFKVICEVDEEYNIGEIKANHPIKFSNELFEAWRELEEQDGVYYSVRRANKEINKFIERAKPITDKHGTALETILTYFDNEIGNTRNLGLLLMKMEAYDTDGFKEYLQEREKFVSFMKKISPEDISVENVTVYYYHGVFFVRG